MSNIDTDTLFDMIQDILTNMESLKHTVAHIIDELNEKIEEVTDEEVDAPGFDDDLLNVDPSIVSKIDKYFKTIELQLYELQNAIKEMDKQNKKYRQVLLKNACLF